MARNLGAAACLKMLASDWLVIKIWYFWSTKYLPFGMREWNFYQTHNNDTPPSLYSMMSYFIIDGKKIISYIYFIHLCHKQSPVGHMGHMVCPRCHYCMSCHQCQNNTRLEVQVLNLWALKQLAELNHVGFWNCKGNQLIWSRSL